MQILTMNVRTISIPLREIAVLQFYGLIMNHFRYYFTGINPCCHI